VYDRENSALFVEKKTLCNIYSLQIIGSCRYAESYLVNLTVNFVTKDAEESPTGQRGDKAERNAKAATEITGFIRPKFQTKRETARQKRRRDSLDPPKLSSLPAINTHLDF
jgi:hypothetical protein